MTTSEPDILLLQSSSLMKNSYTLLITIQNQVQLASAQILLLRKILVPFPLHLQVSSTRVHQPKQKTWLTLEVPFTV